MAKENITALRTRGNVFIDRLADETIPAPLKPWQQAFVAIHKDYVARAAAVDGALDRRDEALALVGSADDVIDGSIVQLANELVGARLGDRKNPFKKFSKHAPSDMVSLAYAKEVDAALELVRKVEKAKPPATVKTRLQAIKKQAGAVEAALKDLARAQAAYDKALSKRDALLPGWLKAEKNLKTQAKAAWMEQADIYDAVFAPVADIQAPVAHKRAPRQGTSKTKSKNAAPSTPPAPPPKG